MIELKFSGKGSVYPYTYPSKHASDADYIRVCLTGRYPWVLVRTRSRDERAAWEKIVAAGQSDG